MIYLDAPCVQVRLEKSIAIIEWKGLAKGEVYRKAYEQLEKLTKEKNVSLWLMDFSGGKVIDIKDQKWTTDEWAPQAASTLVGKLHKVGVILSTDVFSKVASRVIVTKVQTISGAEVAYFNEKRDAMAWLTQYESVAA